MNDLTVALNSYEQGRIDAVEDLRAKLLADPRAEVEGNIVWNAVVNQVLKLTEKKEL